MPLRDLGKISESDNLYNDLSFIILRRLRICTRDLFLVRTMTGNLAVELLENRLYFMVDQESAVYASSQLLFTRICVDDFIDKIHFLHTGPCTVQVGINRTYFSSTVFKSDMFYAGHRAMQPWFYS